MACASASKHNWRPTHLSEPLEIVLKAHPGRKEVQKYYSKTSTKEFEKGQIKKDKIQAVLFTLQVKDISKPIPKSQTSDNIVMQATVTEKEGFLNLHDMAFPELKETLEYIYDKHANVIFAGGFPKDSMWFIPPISIPKNKVSVGDTWELNHTWRSLSNGLPFELKIITIFKNAYKCPGSGQCIELEISGHVELLNQKSLGLDLQSIIHGRILYSLSHNSVLWSSLVNEEVLVSKDSKFENKSCIVSMTVEPKEISLFKKNDKKLSCEIGVKQAPPMP